TCEENDERNAVHPVAGRGRGLSSPRKRPMTLGEIVASIDQLDDSAVIHARLPWTAESDATVGESGGGLEMGRRVGDSKRGLVPFSGVPETMLLARLVANADRLRADRKAAARDARTFVCGGDVAGELTDATIPSGPGRYEYAPFRSAGHARLSAGESATS